MRRSKISSFGGFTSAMVASIKNNQRPRVSTFETLKGHENIAYKKGTIDKKASPQQLREIKERLQREQKHAMWVNGFIMVTLFVILLLLFKSL